MGKGQGRRGQVFLILNLLGRRVVALAFDTRISVVPGIVELCSQIVFILNFILFLNRYSSYGFPSWRSNASENINYRFHNFLFAVNVFRRSRLLLGSTFLRIC